uniref:Uncharacterized protein n=1 Tax=Vitis vinifera TaxID=29760 RepID=A5B0D9_VITVI|nr:hypothetical protein VITISV_017408 [Vitis vinifera]
MGSRTGSVTNFSGEPSEEGLVLCFETRGEEDALLGEMGGALPAGNREGNGLFAAEFALEQFTEALKEAPAFASLIKDFTCNYVRAIRNIFRKTQIPHIAYKGVK